MALGAAGLCATTGPCSSGSSALLGGATARPTAKTSDASPKRNLTELIASLHPDRPNASAQASAPAACGWLPLRERELRRRFPRAAEGGPGSPAGGSPGAGQPPSPLR